MEDGPKSVRYIGLMPSGGAVLSLRPFHPTIVMCSLTRTTLPFLAPRAVSRFGGEGFPVQTPPLFRSGAHVSAGHAHVAAGGEHVSGGYAEVAAAGGHVSARHAQVTTAGRHVNAGHAYVPAAGAHVGAGHAQVAVGGVHVRAGGAEFRQMGAALRGSLGGCGCAPLSSTSPRAAGSFPADSGG